jgi:hypothetical protein
MDTPHEIVDLRQLINGMADEYERLQRVTVSPEARAALVFPALAHQAEVDAELASGKLTVDVIRDKVMEQLNVAEEVARERSPFILRESARGRPVRITGADALQSMDKRCALMFWC